MLETLRALFIEESDELIRPVLAELRAASFEVSWERVTTPEDLSARLSHQSWDVLLASNDLGQFGGLIALAVCREYGQDMPCLILSGQPREEDAVAILRAGAHDYIPRSNLSRLVPAVRRELREAEARREARRAKEALRHRERQLKAVFNGVNDALLLVDDEFRHVEVNAAATSFFGIARRDFLGLSLADPLVLGGEGARLGNELRAGGGQRELRIRRPDGLEAVLLVSTTPNILSDCHLVVLRDVTGHKENELLQGQLAQAQRLESIGQLAAGIAHEINTPIQYIGDNVSFLQGAFRDLGEVLAAYQALARQARAQGLLAEELAAVEAAARAADLEFLCEEAPRALEQAQDGVGRVARIVRAMKEFSHPGTDEKIPADINHALENTLTVARNEWKYVADLVTDLAPDLPPVPCLPNELNQVFLNLIINAAHTIGERLSGEPGARGTITVRTRHEGDSVQVSVADTGRGIPEALRARVFEPFFTTKPVGKGTGQGLAIAHNVVVVKHGGAIRLESEVGVGTTFTIVLPLEEATAEAAPVGSTTGGVPT